MRIVDPGEFAIFRSTERPWLFCTPDRLIYEGDTLVAELSIKCAFFDSAKEWQKTVPLEYQIQAQHTMYVLGVDTVYYAVLINGCQFRWHTIRRNEKWIRRMLEREDKFWQAIERGEYPNVDESQATARALARRYGSPTAGQIELDDEFQELADEYDSLLETEREADKRKLAIQNLIKDRLGNMTVGVLPDQSGFGWKPNGKGSRRFSRIAKVHVDG